MKYRLIIGRKYSECCSTYFTLQTFDDPEELDKSLSEIRTALYNMGYETYVEVFNADDREEKYCMFRDRKHL